VNILLDKKFKDASLTIYDIRGEQVLNRIVNSENITVDFSNQKPGIYVIEIIDREKVSRVKFVKNDN
jgi:hypothetical protein